MRGSLFYFLKNIAWQGKRSGTQRNKPERIPQGKDGLPVAEEIATVKKRGSRHIRFAINIRKVLKGGERD